MSCMVDVEPELDPDISGQQLLQLELSSQAMKALQLKDHPKLPIPTYTKMIVDSGGSKSITTDRKILTHIKKLQTAVKFGYLTGGNASSEIGIHECFFLDVKSQVILFHPVVMFYLPPDQSKHDHITILATNQAKQQRLGYVSPDDPEQNDFLYAYGDGNTKTPPIPFPQDTDDREWRFVNCAMKQNGLPYVRPLSIDQVKELGLPIVSLVTGKTLNAAVHEELTSHAIEAFNHRHRKHPQTFQSALAEIKESVRMQHAPTMAPSADSQDQCLLSQALADVYRKECTHKELTAMFPCVLVSASSSSLHRNAPNQEGIFRLYLSGLRASAKLIRNCVNSFKQEHRISLFMGISIRCWRI